MSGLPLLSHPPPENGPDDPACRKCNKEFNFLFNRPKRCNHCGYAYCSTCADFQALMPRIGVDRGYDPLPVCFYCIDMLTITASSKNKLRSLSLSALRSYMKAYDIRISGAVLEKDDLVDTILRAKGPNGCLFPVHEDYYRKNSVPQKSNESSRSRNFFSRTTRQETPAPPAPPVPPQPHPQPRPHESPPVPPRPYTCAATQSQQHEPPPVPPRPNAHAAPPRHQHQQQYHTEVPSPQTPFSQPRSSRHNFPPVPPQPRFHTSPMPPQSRPYPSQAQSSSSSFRPSASHTNVHTRPSGTYPSETQDRPQQHPPPPAPPPRPRSAAPTVPATRPQAPPPPPPSLNALLQMDHNHISHLPISTLKAILFENRVNTTVGILEKQDLVDKVIALVTDERRDREIKEREEREEAQRMEWARREREMQAEERRATERERTSPRRESGEVTQDEETKPGSSTNGASAFSPPPYLNKEQEGLCVVCQDEHATMAIIDCGHLALCKGCSEIVMKTSRECPLCRTRIVTEQRLLRIFKS